MLSTPSSAETGGRGAVARHSGPVLEVDGLRVEFATDDGIVAPVDGLSLRVDAGEVLGIVGESGAGKSQTGAAIIGLLEPPGRIAGGRIRLLGRDLDPHDRRAVAAVRGRHVGAIFQDPLTSLDPLFTIGDQLMETIAHHTGVTERAARARALEMLVEVGIPDPVLRMAAYPHELSGGLRQRVVIALALCLEPELVIADEPTTALDVSVQAQIISLIKRLCRQRGTAVVLITHDMGVIAQTADRVAVMYAGRIVETGAVADVVARPHHPYTRGLMRAIPQLGRRERRLTQIAGAMPPPDSRPAGCAFHPRCSDAIAKCRHEVPAVLEDARGGAVACFVADTARTVSAVEAQEGVR